LYFGSVLYRQIHSHIVLLLAANTRSCNYIPQR